MNQHRVATIGQFLINALGGKLGAPMMVLGYLVFALLLLGYVSTQVYTSGLMESVAARKRTEIAMQEKIGVLTAQYTTLTSKSRVSAACEGELGLVESTSADVVRVVVEGQALQDPPRGERIRVDDVLGSEVSGLSQVMQR